MGTVASIAGLLISLGLVVITALKGKYVFALLGLFLPVFSLVGAIRLAKPQSWWATNRYDEAKLAQSAERFA